MGRTAVLAVLFPGARDEGARVMPRLSPCGERRLLQWSVAVLALVPVLAGGAGVVSGLSLFGVRANLPLGGDSHVRYLSGLILGLGLGFWSTVPRIELADLKAEIDRICGGPPRRARTTDQVVAAIQWVDGTTIDCVRAVMPS